MVLSSNRLPVAPLGRSGESPVKKEELEVWLNWEELPERKDVALVTDNDFFSVFCVAVRLQSEFSASLSLPQQR